MKTNFGGLPGLEVIDISANGISDASFAVSLPRLRWFDIRNNKIFDITALGASFDLQHLYLDGNRLCDVPLDVEDITIPHTNSSGTLIALKIQGAAEQDRSLCLQ